MCHWLWSYCCFVSSDRKATQVGSKVKSLKKSSKKEYRELKYSILLLSKWVAMRNSSASRLGYFFDEMYVEKDLNLVTFLEKRPGNICAWCNGLWTGNLFKRGYFAWQCQRKQFPLWIIKTDCFGRCYLYMIC